MRSVGFTWEIQRRIMFEFCRPFYLGFSPYYHFEHSTFYVQVDRLRVECLTRLHCCIYLHQLTVQILLCYLITMALKSLATNIIYPSALLPVQSVIRSSRDPATEGTPIPRSLTSAPVQSQCGIDLLSSICAIVECVVLALRGDSNGSSDPCERVDIVIVAAGR